MSTPSFLGRQKILSVVLAGGEGKRLMPLTEVRAKPAVPFGGKYRLIDFAISNLVNGGFRHIVVLTQYKSHSLDRHISLTWQLSTLLGNYVTTVPAQMRKGPHWFTGSADALYQNLNLVDDEGPDHVIVFGADHIYRFDPRQMLEMHVASGAGVTVAAIQQPREMARDFGVIERASESNKILGFHEKNPDAPTIPGDPSMVLASMGNYIFDAQVLRDSVTSDSESEGSSHDIGGDLIPALVASGDAQVYDYADNKVPGESHADGHYWRDVGTLDSYFEASMDLVAPVPRFNLYNSQWPIFTQGLTEPPAKLSDAPNSPTRVSNCILSSGAIIGGASVSDSVLSRGVHIMEQANVDQSVLMEGVVIEPGARLRRCIVDKNVRIPAGFAIGIDGAADAARFHVSTGGVVAVPKNYTID